MSTRGASRTTERTVDVDFSSKKEFVDSSKIFTSVELAEATVEVLSIGETNEAKNVSGSLSVSRADGSDRVEIGQYSDLAIEAGASVSVTLSQAGRDFVNTLLKEGTYTFKAYVTGTLDAVPASMSLRTKLTVNGKVGSGGTKKDLGCIALGVSGSDPAPSCTPNPCKNDGDCAVSGEILVCACKSGFSGLVCDKTSTSTPCLVDQHVASGACVDCEPGAYRAAGDDPAGADTACAAASCEADEYVAGHVCLPCAAGTTNVAGDDASGADTSCDAVLCAANQFVQTHACVACPAGSTRPAGDDASSADTACEQTVCTANQYVANNACVACVPGAYRAAGDLATGMDTACDTIYCAGNERVLAHACVPCAPEEHTVRLPGDDATGDDTVCDACMKDYRVSTGECQACPTGKGRPAGDLIANGNTICVTCAENYHVESQVCVACPAGSTRPAGDVETGVDTLCQSTLCEADQYVSNHACVACQVGYGRAPGDAADGNDTTCDFCADGYHANGTGDCVPCPTGTTHPAGDDPVNDDTECAVCATDFRVEGGNCVACPTGYGRPAGDDPTGADTTCDTCAENYFALFDCLACSSGTTNEPGDDPAGIPTSCDGSSTFDFGPYLGGQSATESGGHAVLRALEVEVSGDPVAIVQVRVDGLPAGLAESAKLWTFSDANGVDPATPVRFAPTTGPYIPSATTERSATFTFVGVQPDDLLTVEPGFTSFVIATDDVAAPPGSWDMSRIPLPKPQLSVAPVSFTSIWGWWGYLDEVSMDAPRIFGVSAYADDHFLIPNITIVTEN